MDKYGSRKFIVTMTDMALAAVLAAIANMDTHVALVLAAGIGAYNWANVSHANGK